MRPANKKNRRDALWEEALHTAVEKRTLFVGAMEFPAVPALSSHFVRKIVEALGAFGHGFNSGEAEHLRTLFARALAKGYETSAESRVLFKFKTPPGKGVEYEVQIRQPSMEEYYETWAAVKTPPLFGKLPDAMVTNTAVKLGAPSEVRVLDVGAGTGRNAIALARLGHPVTAVEPVAKFAEQIREAASGESLPLTVVENDLLSPDVCLDAGSYGLVILCEVLTHFREVAEIREAFSKFSEALSPGGLVVANAFIADRGYRPDDLAKQVGEMAWSCLYTASELDFITEELPFEKIGDEPVCEYEKANLPASGWPPTGWFVGWSTGRNVFTTAPGVLAPIELRWLVYRRRA